MRLPLEGIKVVDLAQILAGPVGALHLADQGANVIKIEPPGGDGARDVYTTSYLGKLSKPWLAVDRNKRSIVVDLTREAGRDVVHCICETADVVITNFRPNTAKRLGMDYSTLKKKNERLIYAAVSGFGSEGDEADLPAYDLVLQGKSGILGARQMPDGTPIAHSVLVADMSCGMMLAYAVMLALWDRRKTGKGQRIDISLLGQALAMQAQQLVNVEGDKSPIPGHLQNALYAPYRCQSLDYLVLTVVENPQWVKLCKVLGLNHMAEDPAYATHGDRLNHNNEIYEILSEVFITKPRFEWLQALRNESVPAGPVADRSDVFTDQQVLANDIIVTYQHPGLGSVQAIGIPFRLSNRPIGSVVRIPAPDLGQHTRQILEEFGYQTDEIQNLIDLGIVQA